MVLQDPRVALVPTQQLICWGMTPGQGAVRLPEGRRMGQSDAGTWAGERVWTRRPGEAQHESKSQPQTGALHPVSP